MSDNGLEINESQFCNMTGKQQNLILFKNTVKIEKKINIINERDENYKLNKKIQYWWLSSLTTIFFGYLGIKSKLGL